MKKKIFNIVAVILFLFLAWLLFANLSDHYLWNDEASTAILSRNVLKYGYPSSFDGTNLHYPDWPEFHWPGTYMWKVDPWAQNYLMAASFKLFGINTWSARLPFVLSGFLTLVILFMFCSRYLGSKKIGLFSILLMGTSVPFLLHARQARYYGLVILLSFAVFYLYHRVVERKKGYLWLAIVSLVLSLTHHVVFIPIFGAVWLSALFIDRKEIKWKNFILMSILPVLAFLAWVVFSWVGSDPIAFPISSSLKQIKKNLEFQIRTINGYFVPIAFWAALMIISRALKKHSFILLSEKEKRIFSRLGIFLLCNMIIFTFVGLRTMRYYVHYLPFLFMLEGFLIFRVFQQKKVLAVGILALVIFTNIPGKANPAKLRSYFSYYIYEITHEYTGPLEAVCRYLDFRARPGERVKIIKGDLTVMFYHPELVILNDERYFEKTYPEWIVIRKYWNPILESRWKTKFGVEPESGYLDVVDVYDKVLLPAVDSIRENEPDNLETHFFKSPKITPENQMFIYHLKDT